MKKIATACAIFSCVTTFSQDHFDIADFINEQFLEKKLQRFEMYADTFSVLSRVEQTDPHSPAYANYKRQLDSLIVARFEQSQTPFTEYAQLIESSYNDVHNSLQKSPSLLRKPFELILANLERLFTYVINSDRYINEQPWYIRFIYYTPFSSYYVNYKKQFFIQ